MSSQPQSETDRLRNIGAIIIGVAFLVGLYAIFIANRLAPINSSSELNQLCPEEWYVNKMPQIIPDEATPSPSESYFIVDGQRVETDQIDIEWVQSNCDITQPTPVF